MNGPIVGAGHMFAFFSRIGTAEPTTAAKQGTISRETGVVRAIPGFRVNQMVRKPSTIEQVIPNRIPVVLSTTSRSLQSLLLLWQNPEQQWMMIEPNIPSHRCNERYKIRNLGNINH